MSSLPGDTVSKITFEVSDKLIHAGVYFLLYLLFQHSLHNQTKYPFLKENAFLFSLIFTVIYGATDEFHQYFVPYRQSDIYDLMADATGAIIAYLIAKTLILYKNRKTGSNLA